MYPSGAHGDNEEPRRPAMEEISHKVIELSISSSADANDGMLPIFNPCRWDTDSICAAIATES